MIPLLMIHGVGCDGVVFNRLAGLLSAQGFNPRTPTLFPDLRVGGDGPPPAGLARLCLKDYVDAMEAEARAFEREAGRPVALLGHSMGGLIVQKLLTRGMSAAGVLLTPAQPVDCQVFTLAPLYTFWNIIKSNDMNRAHKVWEKGFRWGVVNCVDKAKHRDIYKGALFDSGLVYRDLGRPRLDPNRVAFIDEADIKAPVLTIGAKRDRVTPVKAVRKVGEKYAKIGGTYLEYPNSGHWLLDEPETERAASDIATWLKSKLA
jgi:alpha-beta hydrolase superfamily lysophospholipase